jgi:hypothetical protein
MTEIILKFDPNCDKDVKKGYNILKKLDDSFKASELEYNPEEEEQGKTIKEHIANGEEIKGKKSIKTKFKIITEPKLEPITDNYYNDEPKYIEIAEDLTIRPIDKITFEKEIELLKKQEKNVEKTGEVKKRGFFGRKFKE